LYVGNLSYDTTQTDLENLFAEVGEVTDVFIPSDRVTGRPRGFAFVSFRDDAMAAAAITRFDGHELAGRALKINEAEERSQTPRFRASPGGGGGWNDDARKRSRPKGSRKNSRARKRSL
jgi:RNA recognition motif-containing protein